MSRLVLVVVLLPAVGCDRGSAPKEHAPHDAAPGPEPSVPAEAAIDAGPEVECPAALALPGWAADRWTAPSAGAYRAELDKRDARYGRMRRAISLHVDARLGLTLDPDGRSSMCVDATTESTHGSMPALGGDPAQPERRIGPRPERHGWRGTWWRRGECVTVRLVPSSDACPTALGDAPPLTLACAEAAASDDAGARRALLVCATNQPASPSRNAYMEHETSRFAMSLGGRGTPPRAFMIFGGRDGAGVLRVGYDFRSDEGRVRSIAP